MQQDVEGGCCEAENDCSASTTATCDMETTDCTNTDKNMHNKEEDTSSCSTSTSKGAGKSVLDDEGELVRAIHLSNEERAIQLLKEGADPNTVTKGGWTVLHMAALSESPEITR